MGHPWRSCRDNLEVVGLTISTPAHHLHESNSVLVGVIPLGLDGRSEAVLSILQGALGSGPWHITPSILKSRLAVAGGDGQYAEGEESVHNPSKVLYVLFEQTGRVPRIGWDGFHRLNHAGMASMRSSDIATEFFQLLHDLQAQFGYGQGRTAAHAVADVMGGEDDGA